MPLKALLYGFHDGAWKWSALLAMVPLIAFLTGCESVTGYVGNLTGYVENLTDRRTAPKFEPKVGPKLAPAQLPRYKSGQTFAFDDGRREVVLKVKGELLRWRKNRYATATAYRNFLIPSLSWETRHHKSRSTITASPRMLWPLRVGNDERFDVTEVVEEKGDANSQDGEGPKEYKHSWRCAVERTETLTVPAGTFDTYRIACFRYRPGTADWRQTRIFHYAPKIGHFISRVDVYASRPSRRIQLTTMSIRSVTAPRSRERRRN